MLNNNNYYLYIDVGTKIQQFQNFVEEINTRENMEFGS